MNKIQSLKIFNLRAHRNTLIDFDRINLFAGASGSGKSTIRAAITMAMTGRCEWTDGRGAGSDLLVSDNADEYRIELKIDGVGTVVRTSKGGLQVADENGELWQGTSSKQQAALLEKLGISSDALYALLCTEQVLADNTLLEKMLTESLKIKYDMATATAALEKYLTDTEVQGPLAEQTKKEFAKADGTPADKLGGVFYQQRKVKKAERDVLEQALAGKARPDVKPEWVVKMGKSIEILEDLKKQREEALKKGTGQKDLLTAQKEELLKQREKLEEELTKIVPSEHTLEETKLYLQTIDDRIKEIQNELIILRQLANTYQISQEREKALYDELSKIPFMCPIHSEIQCPLQAGDIKNVLEAIDKRRIEAGGKLRETKAKIKELEEKEKRQNVEHNYALADYDNAQKYLKEYLPRKARLDQIDSQIQTVDQQLINITSASAEGRIEDVEKLNERIRKGEEVIANIKLFQQYQAFDETHLAVNALEILVKIFDKGGLRSLVLSQSAGSFIDEWNKELQSLTGGVYQLLAEYDPLTIFVRVSSTTNARPYRLLSTSERMRVAMALQLVLSKKYDLGWFIVDETNILDQTGKSQAVKWLFMHEAVETGIVLSALGDRAPQPSKLDGLTVWLVEKGTVQKVS